MFDHEITNCSPLGFMGRLACLNFGGGGQKAPKPPKQQPIKFPKMPEMHIPETPASQPIAPPPTATRAEGEQAAADMRMGALKKKGLRRTILAGESQGKAQLGGGTILGGSGGGTPAA